MNFLEAIAYTILALATVVMLRIFLVSWILCRRMQHHMGALERLVIRSMVYDLTRWTYRQFFPHVVGVDTKKKIDWKRVFEQSKANGCVSDDPPRVPRKWPSGWLDKRRDELREKEKKNG